MKIAIDARESGTTTGRYVDKLVEHLYQLESEHDFVIMVKSHRLDFMKRLTPNFEVLEANFKEFTFSEQISFLRFCRNIKADLIHFPIVQQPILYQGKTVTTMNDLTTLRFKNPAKNSLLFGFKQLIYGQVNKKVAKKSDHIITYTNYVRDDILDFLPRLDKKKFTTTYLAADKIKDTPQPVEGLIGEQFIMYIGRPQPHKNLRRLIEAFAYLQKTRPKLKLVLAGKRDILYDQHANYIKDQAIENVIFTDFVSEGQLRWLYENCTAYVFPSLSEGFGLPGLEAMLHGAPVVSSNATCLPEVYGEAAHYFDPLDTIDIANKINDVLTDIKLRQKLINRGKEQLTNYSWQTTAQKTLEIYKKVLRK